MLLRGWRGGLSIGGHTITDQLPSVYTKDSITYYRASSLSQCPRTFIFARQGHVPRIPHTLQEAFTYGIEHEEYVVDMLKQRGAEITDQQLEVELKVSPTIRIIGHIDGIIGSSILEIKCLSHDNVEKFRDDRERFFPYYMTQISVYMHSLRLPALFAIYDKDEDSLHTINVPTPPIPLEGLITRVEMLESYNTTYNTTDILPDCETTSFCPFFYLHQDYKDGDDEYQLDKDAQLSALVRAYSVLNHRLSVLEESKSNLRSKIEARLGFLEVEKARSDSFSVSISRVHVDRLDNRKVRKYLSDTAPDKLAEFLSSNYQTRITVKELNQDV